MPPSIDVNRELLFSESDISVIVYVLSVVETGNVVSFVEMGSCGLSIEGKVKCIYAESRIKKDREQGGKGQEQHGGMEDGRHMA